MGLGCNEIAFRINVLGSRQSKKILEQIKEIIKHYFLMNSFFWLNKALDPAKKIRVV